MFIGVYLGYLVNTRSLTFIFRLFNRTYIVQTHLQITLDIFKTSRTCMIVEKQKTDKESYSRLSDTPYFVN